MIELTLNESEQRQLEMLASERSTTVLGLIRESVDRLLAEAAGQRALEQEAALSQQAPKLRDLSKLSGAWVEDPRIDEALADQRRIDPEAWR